MNVPTVGRAPTVLMGELVIVQVDSAETYVKHEIDCLKDSCNKMLNLLTNNIHCTNSCLVFIESENINKFLKPKNYKLQKYIFHYCRKVLVF